VANQHTYEEIRAAALDVLAGRERVSYPPQQYESIRIGVGEVLARRENRASSQRDQNLSVRDSDLFLEVFWDLFRQGIITLGFNDSNREFPHCRVSHFGQRVLASGNPYFFHDVSSYTRLINAEVPTIDPATLVYLQEAVQAFYAGCILSATVLLGVATEHTFYLLLEDVESSSTWASVFAPVGKERSILPKLNRFKAILDKHLHALPPALKEDLDTRFAGILSVIRQLRNQAGHPTGKIIDREQAYVLLHLFVPHCRKMYDLRDFLRGRRQHQRRVA
jgi:hypothetical protein